MTALEKIALEVSRCDKCPLSSARKRAVPGEGPAGARVMLVGEAPGANEDRAGRPFCGAAGRVLDELLAGAGLERREVFIANILKCRPPGNRNPRETEIKACSPWLEAQFEALMPEVVCCLGNFATAFVLGRFGLAGQVTGITKIHGRVFPVEEFFRTVKIIPLFHPAVATYDAGRKPQLVKDFQVVKECLDGYQGFPG